MPAAGKWNEWCDLFSADMVYQEQLAGHIEGREAHAPDDGLVSRNLYKMFYNVPQSIFVSGDNRRRRCRILLVGR